jgi:hypothetical protein
MIERILAAIAIPRSILLQSMSWDDIEDVGEPRLYGRTETIKGKTSLALGGRPKTVRTYFGKTIHEDHAPG